MQQFPFHFPADTCFLREDFVVSDANQKALALLECWPEWGSGQFGRLLYLYGPKGAGKTHLAHIWQARSQALFLEAALPETGGRGGYILENIELRLQEEERLLHFINRVVEQQGFLLLTATLAPSFLAVCLPDLASRIRALPSVEVCPPDDALLHAVLLKHFSDRQLRIEPEVVSYLLARIERSFASLRSIAEHIDKKALSEKRNITIPLVRELLSHQE